MNVYESVWNYVMGWGCISWSMGVYAPIGMYMKVYAGKWM